MSRKDLAVATGYSETQIGRLERGKIENPAYKMIAEIEDTFHINVLNQEVVIDGKKQYVNNAIKIYCKSVFDALNENDSALIRFYQFEL